MRDVPIGVVVVVVSLCAAVCMMCLAYIVAAYPSMKRELRELLPPEADHEHELPPSLRFPLERTRAFKFDTSPSSLMSVTSGHELIVRPFSRPAAKGFGSRKSS